MHRPLLHQPVQDSTLFLIIVPTIPYSLPVNKSLSFIVMKRKTATFLHMLWIHIYFTVNEKKI
ncbi:hypothetical protein BHL25_11920 [Bacillus cereus]|nr:hypothetical protein BHL25_11920 [Bacillus cereus]